MHVTGCQTNFIAHITHSFLILRDCVAPRYVRHLLGSLFNIYLELDSVGQIGIGITSGKLHKGLFSFSMNSIIL